MNVISLKQQIPTSPDIYFYNKETKKKSQLNNRFKNTMKYLSTYNRTYSQLFTEKDFLYTAEQKINSNLEMKYFIKNIINNSKNINNIEILLDTNNIYSILFRFDNNFSCALRVTKHNFLIFDIKQSNQSDNDLYVFTKKSFINKFNNIYDFFHFQFPEYFAENDNLYIQLKKYIFSNIHVTNCQETSLMIEKRKYIENKIKYNLINDKKQTLENFDLTILKADTMNYNYEHNFSLAVLYLYDKFLINNKVNRKEVLISHIKYRRKAKKSNILSGHDLIQYAHNEFNENDILSNYPVNSQEFKVLLNKV
jgi:hypothetical protein